MRNDEKKSVGLFLGRFDANEEYVPLVVFTGWCGAAAGEGLIQYLGV